MCPVLPCIAHADHRSAVLRHKQATQHARQGEGRTCFRGQGQGERTLIMMTSTVITTYQQHYTVT